MNVSTSDWLEQVVWEAQAGRDSALRLLYLKYAPRLHSYLYYLADDSPPETESLIQTILREAVQSCGPTARGGVSFGTRAHRAARLVLARPRAQVSAGPRDRRAPAWDQVASPAGQTPFALDCQSLRAALRHLDDDERQVAVLRLVQRLSATDVAWVLERAEEEILRLQARALIKLKVVLQSWGSHGAN